MSDRSCPLWLGLLAAGSVLAGCGATSSGDGATSTASAAASATVTASATPAPPPPPRLRIVAPRRGLEARDGTIAVRIAVLGGHAHPRLRYAVDGRRARGAADRFVIRGLAPGRHRLLVTLAGDGRVHARTVFAVRKPPPPPPPPPVTSVPPTMNAPAPMTTPASPPAMGIPQNGGGDGDGDNSGGPSDGDGLT